MIQKNQKVRFFLLGWRIFCFLFVVFVAVLTFVSMTDFYTVEMYHQLIEKCVEKEKDFKVCLNYLY